MIIRTVCARIGLHTYREIIGLLYCFRPTYFIGKLCMAMARNGQHAFYYIDIYILLYYYSYLMGRQIGGPACFFSLLWMSARIRFRPRITKKKHVFFSAQRAH